jgi:uncharacterized Zn-binding protein involved in type VI secretion
MSHDPADNNDPVIQGGYSSTAPPAGSRSSSVTYNGDGLKVDPPKPPPSQSRKVTVYGSGGETKTGYLGPNGKREGKSKLWNWHAEGGVDYYSYSTRPTGSYDPTSQDVEHMPIDKQGQFSVVHGQADITFNYQKAVDSFFGFSDDPKPPIVERVERTMMAARVSDMTSHWSPLFPGIGSTNVFIGGLPAWRANLDFHACSEPMDVGGPVLVGSPTVRINFMMACRMGDVVMEIPGGPNIIASGCPTVLIGPKGEADFTEVIEPQEVDTGDGLGIHGSVTGDFDSVGCEVSAGVVGNLPQEKAIFKAKAGCMAAVLKGNISGSIDLPLWFISPVASLLFGDHTVTVGVSAHGSLGSVGANGHVEGGYSEEKGVHGSIGADAAYGGGAGFNLFGGIK